MRIKQRLRRTATLRVTRKNAGEKTTFENDGEASKPIRLKNVSIRAGIRTYEIKEAWIVPNFRRQFIACKLPAGEWIVVHAVTNYCVIFGSPSLPHCLRLMELIRPHINAAKVLRGFWDDQKEAVGETVHDYLQHAWRADYQTHELPTVKQWLKSGLKNSHKKWNASNGKMKVKRKR